MQQVGLSGRDIVAILESEARRKPVVADLLARARDGTLTDDEIATAPVPLPWYRKALAEAKKRTAAKAMFDDVIPETLDDGANTQMGTTVIYEGLTCWLKPVRGLITEVKSGDMMFFPDEGGAWLNQTFFSGAQPELKQVRIVEKQTRKGYIEAYEDALQRKY